MEFTIKQSVLKEELGYIQGVVERKSTIPVLSNILIESLGEGSIRIVGTDLDVTIRCDAEADIKTSGAICIQARKLFDIVRTMDGGDVHFKKEDNDWVRMKSGRANFRLAGVNREQYPEIPIFKSAPLKLSAEVFNYFIQNTAFAITNEQSRFTLSGAKFMLADGVARMVTTDGHRLAFVERAIEAAGDDKMDALIPKKALLELVKITRGFDGGIQFGEDQNHIYFEAEGRLLITRKLTGNFPNYEMVMPKDNDKKVVDLDGIDLTDEIAIFIASKIKSNVRELEGSLVRLVAIASLRGVPITKMLAQDALKNIIDSERPEGLTMERIARQVASHYKLTVDEMKSKSNSRAISFPRQIAMYLCKRLTKHSFPEIGREFGGKHHTTVMHSVDKIETLTKEDRNFHKTVSDFIDNLCN
jgi:DNA polymerase III beta subunit